MNSNRISETAPQLGKTEKARLAALETSAAAAVDQPAPSAQQPAKRASAPTNTAKE